MNGSFKKPEHSGGAGHCSAHGRLFSLFALGGPENAQLPIASLRQWGYLGVDFFFAISGYVICLIASRPDFSPLPFAIKRLFRIFPMYWLAISAVAVLVVVHLYRPESLVHFLYSMSLLPQQHVPAYDPSWTLEREIAFYTLATVVVPIAGIREVAVTLSGVAIAGWYLGNPSTFHLVSTRMWSNRRRLLTGESSVAYGSAKSPGLPVTVVLMNDGDEPLGNAGFRFHGAVLWLGRS